MSDDTSWFGKLKDAIMPAGKVLRQVSGEDKPESSTPSYPQSTDSVAQAIAATKTLKTPQGPTAVPKKTGKAVNPAPNPQQILGAKKGN